MAYGDFRIKYPGVDFRFGPYDSGFGIDNFPEYSVKDYETDDTARPRTDGIAFGQDFDRGAKIIFEVDAYGTDIDSTLAAREAFAEAWSGDEVRGEGGALAELHSLFNDRVAYGRPRRIDFDDRLVRRGNVSHITAEFEMVNALWFDIVPQQVDINFASSLGGGVVAPVVAPVTTTQAVDRSVVVRIDGKKRTYPVLIIRGPITNPVVECVGRWRIEFLTTLEFDESIIIDTRPWSRGIFRDNGRPVVATRQSTRLDDIRLAPGPQEFALRGISQSGTASLNVQWQSAYKTY